MTDALLVRPGASPASTEGMAQGEAGPGLRLSRRRSHLEEADAWQDAHVVALNIGAPVWSVFRVGGITQRVRTLPGQALFAPWRQAYRAHCESDTEWLVAEVAAGPGGGPAAVLVKDDPLVAQVLLALADEASQGEVGAPYRESLGLALAAHLARRYGEVPRGDHRRGGLPAPALRRVLSYIDGHVGSGDTSLPALAHLAGLSVYHFVRSFKESTGLPPHRYLLHRRIDQAKALLAGGRVPVGEIAQRVGFASHSAFTVAFRRMTRSTPRAFRAADGGAGDTTPPRGPPQRLS